MRALHVVLGGGLLAVAVAGRPVDLDEELLEGWAQAVAAAQGSAAHPVALPLRFRPPAAARRPLRGQAKPRPVVPPQWSATLLSFSGNMMGIDYTDGVGMFYYDRPGQRLRTTYNVTTSYFRPNFTQVQDSLSMNTSYASGRNMTIGAGDDGACVVFGAMGGFASYNDLFAFVKDANYTGSRVTDDGPCDVWRSEFNIKSILTGYAEGCFGADGAAREHVQVIKGRFNFYQRFKFANVSIGHLPDKVFAPSYACDNFPPAPCESQGVETLEVYRIFGGPPEPVELRNRNAGDDLGDLSFVCTQASADVYRKKQITWWTVEVDTAFGEYALCNYNGTDNVCTSGDVTRAGRRSAQMSGEGAVLGQCSANNDVGSQYSFPAVSECPPGTRPGAASGCTWGNAVARRTILANCVMVERGLLDACHEEVGHAPFRKAQRIFRAAFESDDPAKGGCPDAPASELQLVV